MATIKLSVKIRRLKRFTYEIYYKNGSHYPFQEECVTLEEEVEDRVTNLVSLLQARKLRLIEAARQTREARVRSLRDQVARCATHLQATTALLTFCIEALKETDSAAFLQIGGMLSVRAATAAGSWGGAEGVQEIARLPLLDLTLDDKPLRRAIDQLTFVQLKRESALMGECGLHGRVMSVCERRLNLPGDPSGDDRE